MLKYTAIDNNFHQICHEGLKSAIMPKNEIMVKSTIMSKYSESKIIYQNFIEYSQLKTNRKICLGLQPGIERKLDW
ncbi:MAG: hypothetical protein LBC41_05170, partial [Clostridiales bacterium]|nr:hypothetical protein [Clostridiales bacterium]